MQVNMVTDFERDLAAKAYERRRRMGVYAVQPARIRSTPPEPEKPKAGNKLGVFSITEERKINIHAMVEDYPVVQRGRHLSKLAAIEAMRRFCEGTDVTLEEALGTGRKKRTVAVRRACWTYLVDKGHSYSEIGRTYGWDHTTVLWAVRQYREALNGTL